HTEAARQASTHAGDHGPLHVFASSHSCANGKRSDTLCDTHHCTRAVGAARAKAWPHKHGACGGRTSLAAPPVDTHAAPAQPDPQHGEEPLPDATERKTTLTT